MPHITPPLFGSEWTASQVERFEEIKNDASVIFVLYESAETELAFLTFRILNEMIPDEPPPDREALIRVHKTAIEIVCRRLLGEGFRSRHSGLCRREPVVPEPMEEERSRLIDRVQYWFDQRKDITGAINLDQLRRLEIALRTAQDDRKAIKRARNSWRRRRCKELGV
jgi:hypothetical protein